MKFLSKSTPIYSKKQRLIITFKNWYTNLNCYRAVHATLIGILLLNIYVHIYTWQSKIRLGSGVCLYIACEHQYSIPPGSRCSIISWNLLFYGFSFTQAFRPFSLPHHPLPPGRPPHPLPLYCGSTQRNSIEFCIASPIKKVLIHFWRFFFCLINHHKACDRI